MYVQTKVKQEVKDVSNARIRLDATLQSLVDKKEESAESTAESEDDHEGPVMISVPVVRSSGSPAASPSKRIMMRNRKRKRRHDSMDANDAGAKYHQTSYVMRLFDRSVDLAQFSEKTPLYPIARAWMKNNMTDEEDEQSQEEKEDERDPNALYRMPNPVRLKHEGGMIGDPRVPPPVISDEEPLDIHKDPDLGPPPEELLLRHMARWKTVRQRWIEASRNNEMRFSNSMTILKDMFEQNLQNVE